MSVFPVTSFGLILPTNLAAQLNRSLTARNTPLASPISSFSQAPLASATALPTNQLPGAGPLTGSLTPPGALPANPLPPAAAPSSLNPFASTAASPLGLPATVASPLGLPAAATASPQPQADQMFSMMGMLMQAMIQMICTMLGHNPGATGNAPPGAPRP
jgi:hypothetical protein